MTSLPKPPIPSLPFLLSGKDSALYLSEKIKYTEDNLLGLHYVIYPLAIICTHAFASLPVTIHELLKFHFAIIN